jgi:hypothetical protein
MKTEFKYEIGQKVLLRDDAQHSHQKKYWRKEETGEEYGIIEKAYISERIGGKWYRIITASGYGNSYPEEGLDPIAYSNKEAKTLLSKEW